MPLASTSRNPSHPVLRTLSRWLIGTVGLAWVAIAATLCGCGTTNGWVMNESGKGYYRRGDYSQAAREFERAMMDRPDRADYAYNYAAAMDQVGNHQVAEKVYRHALSLDPGHQPSYHGLAALMVEEGRTKEANDLIGTWAATQPYSAEATTELGWLKAEEGDLDGADRELRKALRQNPNNTRAKKQLARVYSRSGRREEAAAEYASSLFVDPLQSDVQAEMAANGYGPYGSPALQLAGAMQPQFTTPMGQPQMAGTSGVQNFGMPSQSPTMSQNQYPMAHSMGPQYSAPPYSAQQYSTPQYSAPMGSPPVMGGMSYAAPGVVPGSMTESDSSNPSWSQPMGVTANSMMSGYPDAVSLPPVSSNQHVTARPQAGFFQPQRSVSPGVSGAQFTAPVQQSPVVTSQPGTNPAAQPVSIPTAPNAHNSQLMMTGYGDAPAWNANPGIGNVVPAGQMTTAPVVPAF